MEKEILNLFLYNYKIKFNELQKLLKVRSNKLAYHLKRLVRKGVLTKNNELYQLSEASECLIPFLSSKKSALPVVLIFIGNKNKVFLFKRTKRPFKDSLSLPGGRLLVGESPKEASERIMKEKFNLDIKFKRVNSISLEHVRKSGKIIHSFLLVFVSAEAKDAQLTDISKNKSKIIPSDYKLIRNNSDMKFDLRTIVTKA